jgi:diguanylate cyclase (GGDEF)-like protein
LMKGFEGVYFDWNLIDNSCFWGGSYQSYFDTEMPSQNFPNSVMNNRFGILNHVSFYELIAKIKDGSVMERCEIQFVDQAGEIRWYQLKVTTLLNDNRIPIRAIGIIDDITAKKTMAIEHENSLEEMEAKLMMDPLTHLYNKLAIQQKITETITSSAVSGDNQQHVLFMLDMDDFKNINDSFGHAYGDEVIVEFAELIKDSFRANDWVGRVGGDEFMVLMRNVKDLQIAQLKAQEIIDKCNRKYQVDEIAVSINVSIGMAVFPIDGVEYETLYQHADEAMYAAKARGKAAYSFYKQHLEQMDVAKNQEPLTVNYRITGQMHEIIYQLLADAKSFDEAINNLLMLIGKRFYASQVLVYLENEQKDSFEQAYNWESKLFQNNYQINKIPKTIVDKSLHLLNDKRTMIYYSTMDMPKEVHDFYSGHNHDGMVQTVLQFEDNIVGVIGVVQGDDNWRITQAMLDFLWISNTILSYYFSKSQSRTINITKAVLLNQLARFKGDGYVVNQYYQLIFINETLRSQGEIQLGDICYKKIKGLSNRCVDCPIIRINDQHNHSGNSLVNNIFKKKWLGWSDTYAIRFPWSTNVDAYAINNLSVDKVIHNQ